MHRPTQLKLPGGFACVAVAAGGFSSAALTRDGCVLTWGASQNGELGRNSFDNRFWVQGQGLRVLLEVLHDGET